MTLIMWKINKANLTTTLPENEFFQLNFIGNHTDWYLFVFQQQKFESDQEECVKIKLDEIVTNNIGKKNLMIK